jgi:hypothetical protein
VHSCLSAGLKALFGGRNLRPLLIGSSLMLFQQITGGHGSTAVAAVACSRVEDAPCADQHCGGAAGQPSVLYYASNILQDAGFAAGKDAEGVSVILGTFKLVMTGAQSRVPPAQCMHILHTAGVHPCADAVLGHATPFQATHR